MDDSRKPAVPGGGSGESMHDDNCEPEKEDDGIEIDPATGAATVTLLYPAMIGETKIEKVTLRRPRGKDLEAVEKASGGEMARTLYFIDILSDDGIPPKFSGVLDVLDIGRMSKVIEDFTNLSR